MFITRSKMLWWLLVSIELFRFMLIFLYDKLYLNTIYKLISAEFKLEINMNILITSIITDNMHVNLELHIDISAQSNKESEYILIMIKKL